MGQVWGSIQDRLQGKQWRRAQLEKITNRVFDRFKDDSGKVNLTFEELYIAVLLVYNDINKHLPGPHFDPPSKVQLKAMIQTFDINLDGELNREEFGGFIQKLAADTLTMVSQRLIIALVAAPTAALLTKRATEGVPGIGKVVQKVPNSIYASIVTLAIVFLQNASKDIE
ncbi:EF-hand domain [Macleaya cordata]|uniref:EF-hand domain n=1 Tax=Macleaya cordata TaxID=56857 RepID=A0A200R6X5_MACCD|nr:EF-hand domain [Macleaya cordata]